MRGTGRRSIVALVAVGALVPGCGDGAGSMNLEQAWARLVAMIHEAAEATAPGREHVPDVPHDDGMCEDRLGRPAETIGGPPTG